MPDGEITLAFGDGEHKFNIAKVGQILELEEKCKAGIGVIFSRLHAGAFFFNDFRETIRLALIGGGMEPSKALVLVQRYVDARPWRESVLPATAILGAAMVGVPGDAVGKKLPTEQTSTETTANATDVSSAPQSTASAQPSDSLPATSTT